MSKTSQVRMQDRVAILRLVGECRELGDDRAAWRRHFVEQMARRVGADAGDCGESAGRGAAGQQPLDVTAWGHEHCADPADVGEVFATVAREPARYSLMPAYLAALGRDDGACRSRREVVDDAAWYSSPAYELVHRPLGVDHVVLCFRSFARGAVDEFSGLLLYRAAGRRDFGARARAIVREAHDAVAALIGGPLARFADPSPLDLAPRARRVLGCLLEGDSDKQIAARLGLSRFTVNQYTKRIFRYFKVNGRPELLARWLRRGRAGQFPWLP